MQLGTSFSALYAVLLTGFWRPPPHLCLWLLLQAVIVSWRFATVCWSPGFSAFDPGGSHSGYNVTRARLCNHACQTPDDFVRGEESVNPEYNWGPELLASGNGNPVLIPNSRLYMYMYICICTRYGHFAYLGHSGGALLVLFGPYLLSLPQPRPHIDVKSDISASNHLEDHSCNYEGHDTRSDLTHVG